MSDSQRAPVDEGTLPAPARRLPEQELREALAAENREDLVVAASVDAGVVTLYRGTLEALTVPAEWFAEVAEAAGTAPDLTGVTPTDHGQTLRLGRAADAPEVSTDAVLYEFDAEARRRMKDRLRRDDGLCASIRRLRKQRGLSQEELADASGLSRRELGRIERGEVEVPLQKTVERVAGALSTTPSELAIF
jgi:DNA-binding XRE family transcriptional regulator